MPRVLPLRSKEPTILYDVGDYNFDVPLTAVGEGSAEALGYHTSYSHWKFTAVYSSPSLRCLQTVTRYLTGTSFFIKLIIDFSFTIFRIEQRRCEYRFLAADENRSGTFRFLRFQRISIFRYPEFLDAGMAGKARHFDAFELRVSFFIFLG